MGIVDLKEKIRLGTDSAGKIWGNEATSPQLFLQASFEKGKGDGEAIKKPSVRGGEKKRNKDQSRQSTKKRG